MPLNQYTTFLHDLELVDGNNFKQADADRMFIAINTMVGVERGPMNPTNSLIRYQLMELLIRVAMEKYPVCPTEALSFEKVCEEHLIPRMGDLNDQTVWRREHTLTESVDNVMKAFRPLFKHLFKEYGKPKMGGQRLYIAMDEFELLCAETGILGDGYCTTA